MNLMTDQTRNLPSEDQTARALELQAEIAEKTCTSISAIEEEITSRVRRVPPHSEQTVAYLFLGCEKRKVWAQSEEAWPITV
jgi:hypothetical protein